MSQTLIMSNQDAVRQAMSSLQMEGFTFDEKAEEMWKKVGRGQLTTEQVRQKWDKNLDELRKKQPDCFSEPDL